MKRLSEEGLAPEGKARLFFIHSAAGKDCLLVNLTKKPWELVLDMLALPSLLQRRGEHTTNGRMTRLLFGSSSCCGGPRRASLRRPLY